MKIEDENCESEEKNDGKQKLHRRRLQVNSVLNSVRTEIDCNRNAHSSPIKGYLSGQESSQVSLQ